MTGSVSGEGPIVLTYHHFRAVESIKHSLTIGGVQFKEEHISEEAITKLRSNGALLIYGTLRMRHAQPILRFVGMIGGLYPKEPFAAAIVDEMLEFMRDVRRKFLNALKLSTSQFWESIGKELKADVQRIENRIKANGGKYVASNKLTIADIEICLMADLFYKPRGKNPPVTELLEADACPCIHRLWDELDSHPALIKAALAYEADAKRAARASTHQQAPKPKKKLSFFHFGKKK
eukprot:GEMP01029722.1.p1 GENE.GEMP01029722.1~~GEMP01029722.1.p1  ORF type:complete len:235 (+),score=35.34 GEMP01029722.1:159-863(+)